MLLRNTMLWLAGNNVVRSAVRKSPLSRLVARRFVAGETAREALSVVQELNRRGMLATMDYLGENVREEVEARAVAQTYVDLLHDLARHRLRCNVSLKLTALGLDIRHELCLENMQRILEAARETDNFVRIDMEGSAYTQPTLDLFEQLYCAQGFRNTGVVLQAYLYRTAGDVDRMIELQARVRLCKGAYREPREIAYPHKDDVDTNYVALARRLLTDGNYPGLATHDHRIIDWTKQFVRNERIANDRWEFQMLYGVRRELQRRLVAEGYNLRVYVPFGEAWYPYLMRRIAERPANLLFALRAIARG